MAAANRVPARGEELVLVVTRFEYALKEISYGKMGAGGAVEAKWDEFANKELTSDFLKHVRENNIAPTILSKPPTRQILNGSSLDWEATAPPTDIQSLFGSVRRVRNNLVHGGKSGDKDSDRNNHLVAEAIAVLMEALRAHADLREVVSPSLPGIFCSARGRRCAIQFLTSSPAASVQA
ncbi:hypothetical protein [Aminobacter aminovorans]